MNKPDWLDEFTFLDSQWPKIQSLGKQWPDLCDYNLSEDWHNYLTQQLAKTAQPDEFKLLRHFRKSRLSYIAFQDLNLPVDFHVKTMRLVSDLADLLIQQAHQFAEKYMLNKYGQVRDSEGEPVELMIWALGKLGTQELNYSSDVDLVFLYQSEGSSDGPRSLEASPYFTRLGQRIIKLLDHFTAEGKVYRVDMRLRPFGSAGPLVCSVGAFGQYLHYEGREWERFAWMRARVVSGDKRFTDQLALNITPFIYRKHLDYTVFDALAKIKTEIADHLDFPDDDLKQGAGGIRAVEFIVQSLQLVFGGRNQDLQGTAIHPQFKQLIDANKIPENDAQALELAWLWLRKMENISQCVADQATHQVPENPVVQQAISGFFSCKDWAEVEKQLGHHRNHVEVMFTQLFEKKSDQQVLASNQRKYLHQLMHEFENKRLPKKRQENVEKLLQQTIVNTTEETTKNFMQLVKSILTRPNYILMLLKETHVHQSVLSLMAESRYFVDVLTRYPVLLEQLFEREKQADFDVSSLNEIWEAKIKNTSDDVEGWMETVRLFKLERQFNLMVAFSEHNLTQTQAHQLLTDLSVFILSEVIVFSHQETVVKKGVQTLSIDQLIVIAYGSAATAQMTLSSDLDLVFVIDVDRLSPEIQLFAQKWVRKIIHHLNTSMYHGKLYDLDMQLRPNGNSGALVTTKDEFGHYQSNQAWLWEHAAMIKSKAIYANNSQARWHHDLRTRVLMQERDKAQVDEQLQQMAEKLEQHKSKSHAVEFKLMAAVLTNSHRMPELVATNDLTTMAEILVEHDLMGAGEVLIFEQQKSPTD